MRASQDLAAPSAMIVNSADGPVMVRVRIGGGQSDLSLTQVQALHGQLGVLLRLIETDEFR